MIEARITFGIGTEDGLPFVRTCRGLYVFETVGKAAQFVAARAVARLTADKAFWDSLAGDLESCNGLGKANEEIPF